MKRTAAELNITAEVRMNPGRIYGRRSGRKFFQSKGVQEDCSGTELGEKYMLELGKKQRLVWKRTTEHGAYLGTESAKEEVLLPKKYLKPEQRIGDEIEVFLYKDSEDRLIATTREPKVELGRLALLEVVQVTAIGAFLDWGLEKDLFLPFKEQNRKLKPGDRCLVALYIDKSDRLCATTKVYSHLECPGNGLFREGQHVKGTIYEVKPELGALVAVENRYFGLVPRQDFFQDKKPGDVVSARIVKIREDGKLDLSLREKAYLQMDADAALVMERIEERGGRLPFTDKAAPLVIQREFGLSKNAFKRAVGRLLKMGEIRLGEDSIEKAEKER